MQAIMRESAASDSMVLERLAVMLASDQMPVQQVVAHEAGVAQSLVSRARNGKLRRVTAKVRALAEYAGGRIGAEELAAIVAGVIDAEAASASQDAEAVSVGAAKLPKRYRKEAMDVIKSYLDDGYDPRLVIEQLAVLRRAQRVRRPGPQPKAISA
jgi:hypothetical protein